MTPLAKRKQKPHIYFYKGMWHVDYWNKQFNVLDSSCFWKTFEGASNFARICINIYYL